jgi:hypothetical protein
MYVMRPVPGLMSATLLVALCIGLTGCERTSSEERVAQTVAIYEVPLAVKTTIDQQSHGGSASAIEKEPETAKRFTRLPSRETANNGH